MRPATTTLQVLSQFGGNTIQQRTNGKIIVADGVGKSEDAKGGEEKEEGEDLGEHCGVVGERMSLSTRTLGRMRVEAPPTFIPFRGPHRPALCPNSRQP